jgi:hypothetical protein
MYDLAHSSACMCILFVCIVRASGRILAHFQSIYGCGVHQRQGIVIDKFNLIEHYSIAREHALKPTTIQVAFLKTSFRPKHNPSVSL